MSPSSMTGFGKLTCTIETTVFNMELRTLNSRYRDIKIRSSLHDGAFEFALRKLFDTEFSRGRIDFTLSMEQHRSDSGQLLDELSAMAAPLGGEPLSITHLLLYKISRSLESGSSEVTLSESGRKELLSRGGELIDIVKRSRLAEGAMMVSTMEQILDRMSELTTEVARCAGEEEERQRERLNKKLEMVLKRDIDTVAMEREIAFILERADITEEITRLKGHLQSFRALLSQAGPCGRNMEFLCQELLREVNTIGSKSQEMEISSLGVGLKNEVEKLRELSANME